MLKFLGALVKEVRAGSAAAQAGIRAGYAYFMSVCTCIVCIVCISFENKQAVV